MAQKTKEKIALQPVGNRVLVQRIENEKTTKGGLIIPDSAKQKQQKARVVAVGKGKKTESGKELPMPVAVDDIILLDHYSGQEVAIDDEEYLIVKADDIIAIVNN